MISDSMLRSGRRFSPSLPTLLGDQVGLLLPTHAPALTEAVHSAFDVD
jgi:hypothetical protein